MAINDGGPVYPSRAGWQSWSDADGVRQYEVMDAARGLSLRDHFAGQALVAIMPTAAAPCLVMPDVDADLYARTAYQLADAMLRVREQEGV